METILTEQERRKIIDYALKKSLTPNGILHDTVVRLTEKVVIQKLKKEGLLS